MAAERLQKSKLTMGHVHMTKAQFGDELFL